MNRTLRVVMCLLIFSFLLTGCGTAYKIARDERSLSSQYRDEQITMSIRQKFMDDKTIKSLDISTYCYRGDVYLVGEYDKPDQRSQAIKLAKSVDGVKSVTDYFLPKKKKDSCSSTDNLSLGTKVKAKLVADVGIESTNIEVKAIQCHIILLGLVDESSEIKKATAHAKSVEGVRTVTSYLKVVK